MENIIQGRIMVGILIGIIQGIFLTVSFVVILIYYIINLAERLSFSTFNGYIDYRNKKKTLEKKELKKNEYKRFEKIYNNMLKNINIEEIDSIRNKLIKQIVIIKTREKRKFRKILVTIISAISIVILLASILMYVVAPVCGPIVIFLGSIVSVVYVKSCEKRKTSKSDIKKCNDDTKIYTALYTEKIITEFLKQFEEKIKYYPAEKMPREIYDMAEFERYDEYFSGNIMNIMLKNNCRAKMTEVITSYITRDSEGFEFHNDIFSGIFALIETPKKFKEELYVKQDEELTERSIIPECEKIQLDSPEFEQYFDIYGTNKIVAMQLLTADIMQMFIDFRKDTGIKFEFVIKNNRIFLRFYGGKIFVIPDLEKSLWDKDLMYENYKILDFTLSLTYKITKLIEETEY